MLKILSPLLSFRTRGGALVLTFLVGGLAGCSNGASVSPTPVVAPAFADVSGDWRFSTTGGAVSIAAGLVDTTGAIAGTGTIYGCAHAPLVATLTGTVDSKGALALTLTPAGGGGAVLLKAQVSSDGKTANSVTLGAAGSSCAAAADQTFVGEVYAPATGSYTGTFTGSDGDAIPVTATLLQGTSPGPGGSYTLSGSVSFPSSPCLATATINSATSTVTGGALSATYTSLVSGQPVSITATGTANASATQVTIMNWTIAGGSCDGYSGTGSLAD